MVTTRRTAAGAKKSASTRAVNNKTKTPAASHKDDEDVNGKPDGYSGANDVQTRATEAAFQPPIVAMSAALLVPLGALMFHVGKRNHEVGIQLAACTLVSVCGFLVTTYMVPLVGEKIKAKLYGVDIGKRGLGGPRDGERVPESLGIVSAMAFMISVGILQALFASSNGQMLEYNTALLSICFATLLGLVDDIIDIKWKHKLIIGIVMSLPMLLSYKGATTVLVPRPLIGALVKSGTDENDVALTALGKAVDALPSVHVQGEGALLDLGILYYGYMLALVVFCTNAVNIYAGINGIEVGQSIIMALSIAVVNLLDLEWRGASVEDVLSGDGSHHLFSLMLMLPFVATSAGLLVHNWYPARCFVGDVYPYYAGMTIATAAILGHFSKSLLFLILPQVVNFIYSVPQLFHMVPIPRHRLPRIDLRTGYLHPSKVAPGDDRDNMTLLCFALRIFGPMHERTLCVVLILLQVICAAIGIFLRHYVAGHIFRIPLS
ncbi:UDP-N-acetylglucosamine--dolichyl-phosphate N-acetylglucosaminephosphotransferase [Hondaea fermentalgiana]|uniref:UDP-N-acetylglucosamine--dolichyl-phosphate N-acetylglucosaminephosphotransferase n=1 Tax=Hondaea fermentalgiana TaxID=2315210 RepID=A0A2R5GR33_9STRA|nr:UDP-N-acetylglucosamine--dolichyl-phosphate N-acetylglucosaminephosphotransferase [Hondaea fermentalgiana]|eukprot:GBG30344.1 UDP-N-acetylglucosamine--dolichyl-phosphate N-acetylglucosaminephosphotransferase [Hondaea fermentalgiana]